MDIYDKEHYKLNKSLLVAVGLWPDQSYAWKFTARCLVGVIMISLMSPLILRITEEWGRDVDEVIENFGSLCYCIICSSKYVGTMANERKHKVLYEVLAKDWKSTTDVEEMKVLRKHTIHGRRLNMGYLIYMYLASTSYCMLPLTPQVLDIILPLNQSRPKIFIYQGDYLCNREDYFYEIFFHAFFSTSVTVTLFVAIDSMYVSCVQHVCGRFSIVESRLKKALAVRDDDFLNSFDKENEEYKSIVNSVICHKEAIKFTKLLESSYTSSFLVVIGFNMLTISVTGIRILMRIGNYFEMGRLCMVSIGQMIHLFYNSLPGQKLINCSVNIFQAAYFCSWYNSSKRTKNLLRLMMLRSLVPCYLTAGKLYVMSLENFGIVMKTSMSYFTVLTSFR